MEAERWSFSVLVPGHQKKKTKQTRFHPIHFKSNGLRLAPSTAGWVAQRRFTGRFTGRWGARARSRPGPEEQQQGNNDLCRQRRAEQRNSGSNENNQTKPISNNYY